MYHVVKPTPALPPQRYEKKNVPPKKLNNVWREGGAWQCRSGSGDTGAVSQHYHASRAYGEVQSHYALGACEARNQPLRD